MLLVRGLGWLLVALAVAVLVNDALSWWSEGGLRLSALGDLWSKLDPGSLGSTQVSVQRFANPGLWNWLARPVLATPALPVFLGIGLLLLWAGGLSSDGRPEPGFVIGSRPPRRRRRGGLG